MSDAAKFLQFPLALLAAGKSRRDKKNLIVGYAAINAGLKLLPCIGEDELSGLLAKIEHKNFKRSSQMHLAWAVGMEATNYAHDPVTATELFQQAAEFLSNWGTSPLVRVDSKLFRETYEDTFDWRDFTVLCAVYSIIGDKQFAIVRRDRVRAGALGYSSGKALFDSSGSLTPEGDTKLVMRDDGEQPLTLNQTRYTLTRLCGRKFLSRIQNSPRVVYYSRGLSHDQLAELLMKRFERKLSAPIAQAEAQEKMRLRMAALLKRCIGGDKKEAEISTAPPPQRHHTVTALISAPPNECSPNACENNATQSPCGDIQQNAGRPEWNPNAPRKLTEAELSRLNELRAAVGLPPKDSDDGTTNSPKHETTR